MIEVAAIRCTRQCHRVVGYRVAQICCGAIRRAVQSAVARVQLRHMQMGSDLRRTVDFMHCLNCNMCRYCDVAFSSSSELKGLFYLNDLHFKRKFLLIFYSYKKLLFVF